MYICTNISTFKININITKYNTSDKISNKRTSNTKVMPFWLHDVVELRESHQVVYIGCKLCTWPATMSVWMYGCTSVRNVIAIHVTVLPHKIWVSGY